MKRTKEEAQIETAAQDDVAHGKSEEGNGMIENAKMEIIPIPVSGVRKRARITCEKERRRVGAQVPRRFQYEPLKALDTRNINNTDKTNETVEVRICSSYITEKNEALKKRSLWGWKTYSCDSDLVCILVHLGIIPHPTNMNAPPKGAGRALPYKELIVTLQIINTEKETTRAGSTLPSHEYNGMRSRFWEAYRDKRIRVMNVQAYGNGNSNNSMVLPSHTVIPSASCRKPLRCCFDASNNPALVYSLFVVADRKTAKRLSKEVLYVEDAANIRYEVSRVDKKQRAAAVATVPEDEKKKGLYVRFARVRNEVIMNERTSSYSSVPLKEQSLQNCTVVKWSALKWSPAGLTLGNQQYKLKRIAFKPKKQSADASPPPSEPNKT